MKRECKWYCYICGKPVEPIFFILWSLNERTDRVFLTHSDCVKLIERPVFVMPVHINGDYLELSG